MPINPVLADSVCHHYQHRFGSRPTLFCAPGRINLLGEHTDHNQGFVLPAAIDKEALFAIDLNHSDHFHLVSIDMNDEYSSTSTAATNKNWANYLLGVMAQVQKLGVKLPGFNLVFASDIPMGAGISSSAALECGLLYALNTLLNLNLSRKTMAKMAQTAEQEYAGVQCGIMDQFAVLHGQQGQVIRLDCRNLDYTLHPLNMASHSLVLCHSGVEHALAATGYNTRRSECQLGVDTFNKYSNKPPIAALRDLTLAHLALVKPYLSTVVLRRCTYVIEENLRVAAACEALDQGNLAKLGQLMFATHKGMSEQFEASCEELDALVNIAKTCTGVLGARIMGGGFGGCSLNLVNNLHLEAFRHEVTEHYYNKRDIEPKIIVTQPNHGARQIQR